MQDDSVGTVSSDAPAPETAVSPNNPCPFLRALVAEGFVDGHVVPLSKLSQTVEAASGEKGLQKKLVGLKTYLVALVANGLGPAAPVAQLVVRRGARRAARRSAGQAWQRLAHPRRDRRGATRAELARLAEFGKDRPDPSGGTERGLTAAGDHRLHGREFRARQGQPALRSTGS